MERPDKGFWCIIGASATIASLCCLTPIVLVLLGLSTASFASSLADTLYWQYKWAFRAAGLLLLAISLTIYFRRRGICTLDQAKRRRNEIVNKVALALIVGIVAYVVFLYVVLHYIGVWMALW